MSSPLEDPVFGDLYLGNTKDDDGQVIDSLVKEVDTPAVPVIEAIDTYPLEHPVKPTRLLTGTQLLDSTYTIPVMIVPPDKNRLHLRVDAFSNAATPGFNDYILIADENGKCQSASTAQRLRHNKGQTIDDYTGALFALPGPLITASSAIEITWEAVTK